MIAFLKKADHVIYKIQEYICIITSVLITALIVAAAIMRYILNLNFGGSEELVLFPWAISFRTDRASDEISPVACDNRSAQSGMIFLWVFSR